MVCCVSFFNHSHHLCIPFSFYRRFHFRTFWFTWRAPTRKFTQPLQTIHCHRKAVCTISHIRNATVPSIHRDHSLTSDLLLSSCQGSRVNAFYHLRPFQQSVALPVSMPKIVCLFVVNSSNRWIWYNKNKIRKNYSHITLLNHRRKMRVT